MLKRIILTVAMTGVFGVSTLNATPIKATQIHFANNDQVTLNLSNMGINRLFVKDDKILSVLGPAGYLRLQNDPSGSMYVNVLVSRPFTAFVVTKEGRHFSIMVRPKAMPATTVVFLPDSPSAAQVTFAKNSVYQQRLISVMKSLLQGKRPKAMGVVKILDPKGIAFLQGNLTLVQQYRGTLLDAAIYRFDNTCGQDLTLAPNQFYRPHVLAASLSKQHLLKGQSLFVYEVVAHQGGSDEATK